MKQEKMFRYLGRNGIITTKIHLEGVSYIPMMRLTASEGMALTNGDRIANAITVEEEEIKDWYEIPAPIKAEED